MMINFGKTPEISISMKIYSAVLEVYMHAHIHNEPNISISVTFQYKHATID